MKHIYSFYDPLTSISLVLEMDDSAAWAFLEHPDKDEILGDTWLWNTVKPNLEFTRKFEELPGLPPSLGLSNQNMNINDVVVKWFGLGISRQARIFENGNLIAALNIGDKGGYSKFCIAKNSLCNPLNSLNEIILDAPKLTSVIRRLVNHRCYSREEICLIVQKDLQTQCDIDRQNILKMIETEVNEFMKNSETWLKVTDVDKLQLAINNFSSLGYDFFPNLGNSIEHGFSLSYKQTESNNAFFSIFDVGEAMRGKGLYIWINKNKSSVDENKRMYNKLIKILDHMNFAVEKSDDFSWIKINNFIWHCKNFWQVKSPGDEWRYQAISTAQLI